MHFINIFLTAQFGINFISISEKVNLYRKDILRVDTFKIERNNNNHYGFKRKHKKAVIMKENLTIKHHQIHKTFAMISNLTIPLDQNNVKR